MEQRVPSLVPANLDTVVKDVKQVSFAIIIIFSTHIFQLLILSAMSPTATTTVSVLERSNNSLVLATSDSVERDVKKLKGRFVIFPIAILRESA